MADKVLTQKGELFIDSVRHSTINGLLDRLLEDSVITWEQMYKVRDENDTAMDKARNLINMVIGKGEQACQKFINYLCEEDRELANKLSLLQDSALIQKRRLFINSVKHGTINALLDRLLEDSVITWEQMNKVRRENDTAIDKARDLIDLVIGKGGQACQKFINYLHEEDRELANRLCLVQARVKVGSWVDHRY